MKIVRIFAEKLFAFHFDDETENELIRLLKLWNDTEYVYEFIQQNLDDIPDDEDPDDLLLKISNHADEINDILYDITEDDSNQFESFFKPLNNQEYQEVLLSKQKGRKFYLRIYAIRIDANCFVITGGAIKFTHLMIEREHTQIELQKLEKCRDFLRENDIIDSDSFYEFFNEEL